MRFTLHYNSVPEKQTSDAFYGTSIENYTNIQPLLLTLAVMFIQQCLQ